MVVEARQVVKDHPDSLLPPTPTRPTADDADSAATETDPANAAPTDATATATAAAATMDAASDADADADATDAEEDGAEPVPMEGANCPGCGMLCKQLITTPLGPGDYYLMGDTYAHCKACDELIPELDEL